MKRKATVPPPPVPDGDAIESYEQQAGLDSRGMPQIIDIWMPCFAAVATDNTGDDNRIGWLYNPSDHWMNYLDTFTAHLVIQLAKIWVTNVKDGFACKPVRRLFRRAMTFGPNNADATFIKNTLPIKSNKLRTPLNILRLQVALSATQTARLTKDMDPGFFNVDELHKTPTEVGDKTNAFAIEDQKISRRAQTVENAIVCKHAAQIAEIWHESKVQFAKQLFLSLREPVVTQEDVSAMAKAYASKGLLGRIGQVCVKVELERKRLMAISVHANRQIKELDKEIEHLDADQKLRATTKSFILAEIAKLQTKEKEVAVKRQAVAQAVTLPVRKASPTPSTTSIIVQSEQNDSYQMAPEDKFDLARGVDQLLETKKDL